MGAGIVLRGDVRGTCVQPIRDASVVPYSATHEVVIPVRPSRTLGHKELIVP